MASMNYFYASAAAAAGALPPQPFPGMPYGVAGGYFMAPGVPGGTPSGLASGYYPPLSAFGAPAMGTGRRSPSLSSGGGIAPIRPTLDPDKV